MEIYCVLRKVTAALHVFILIKYMKNLSNFFLIISQPLLRKSVKVNGIELTLTAQKKKIFFQLKKKHSRNQLTNRIELTLKERKEKFFFQLKKNILEIS